MFYRLIEKAGNVMPVHSMGDLDYMILRGWKVKSVAPEAVIVPVPKAVTLLGKRKYVKKNHM